MQRKKSVSKKSIDSIIKEGEKIFPISIENDKKCEEAHHIENWAEIFFHIKKSKLKTKFIKLMTTTEYAKFFEGLNYEYGINNVKKDIKKAFNVYKNAADKTNDTLSMFRMYFIYKKDFSKFGLKRNRVFEKFYIFKCYAYLEGQELDFSRQLGNRFDIPMEIAIHLDEDGPELKKFEKFIEYLKKYNKQLNINLNSIFLIESLININFKDEIESEEGIIGAFNSQALKTDLETIYKAAVSLSSKKHELADKYFQILISKKYYRSYPDYALFLYSIKKDPAKSLEILKIAYENGIMSAGNLYYDIFLYTCNFSSFIKNMSEEGNLKFIFDLLINLVCIEELYRFFEYIVLWKICVKHYGLKNYLDKLFLDYTKEIVQFILEITDTKKGNNKDFIKRYFQKDEYYQELNLVCGTLFYYGIEGLVEKNIEKGFEKFKISFKSSDSVSYKRFAYSYICIIRKKLNASGNKLISEEKVNKSYKKLFDLYCSSLKSEKEFPYLSSSYFYFLYKLYKNKLGNDGNLLMEYICLKRATEVPFKNPGFGSILQFYRKFKATSMINEEEKTRFKGLLDNINEFNDDEGIGDDNSICPICYENKKAIIFLPCKHIFCELCAQKLLESSRCPICRGSIIHNIKKK